MKHYQLRALVAIADHGGIHAAARALFLSQPAVTKAMRELEQEVGLPLLLRKSRGVTLTPAGQTLLTRARMIVRELERAEEDLSNLKGNLGGRLAIGVTPLAGLTILPQAFAKFRASSPEIELSFFEYSSDQIYDNLKNGSLDFAVGALAEERISLPTGSTELLSLPTSFAIRKGSPYAQSRSLAELQDLEWLHTDLTGRHNLFLSELFASNGLRPPRRITRCSSQSLFYQLAMQNDVVIYWSQLALSAPILQDQFETIHLNQQLPDLKLNLMIREDGLLTRAAEYFIQCVQQVAAQHIAGLHQR